MSKVRRVVVRSETIYGACLMVVIARASVERTSTRSEPHLLAHIGLERPH